MAEKNIKFVLKASDKTKDAFSSAKRGTDALTGSVVNLKSIIGTIGLGFAVKQAFDFAQSTIDAADSVGKFADRAGITTDRLQSMKFAFELAGVGAEGINKGMLTFGKRLGKARQGIGALNGGLKNGEEALLDNLKATNSVSDALDVVFRAMGKAESQTRKLAIADAAFGEAGLRMTAAFREGSEEFYKMEQRARDLGLVLEEDLIRNAEAIKDEFKIASDVLGIQFKQMVLELTPAVSALATGFVEFVQALRDVRKINNNLALDSLRNRAFNLNEEIHSLTGRINELKRVSSAEIAFGTVPQGTLDLLDELIIKRRNLIKVYDKTAVAIQRNVKLEVAHNMELKKTSKAEEEVQKAIKAHLLEITIAKKPITNYLTGLKKLNLQKKLNVITTQKYTQEVIKLEKAFGKATGTMQGLEFDPFANITEGMAAREKRMEEAVGKKALDFNIEDPFEQASGNRQDRIDRELEDMAAKSKGITEQALAPQTDFTSGVQVLQRQLDLGVISIEAFDERMLILTENYGVAVGSMKKDVFDFAGAAQGALEGAFSTAFSSIIRGGEGMKESMAGILLSIGDMIAQMLAKKAAMAAMSWMGFADGGIISGGKEVTAFAKGGIISSPMAFPMKDGFGMVGEAGPEIIAPAKRTKDGGMGISVMGLGAKGHQIINNIVFNFTINKNGNSEESVSGNPSEFEENLYNKMKRVAQEVISEEQSIPGASLAAGV